MSILQIARFGNPILRQTARPVNSFNKNLHSLLDSMTSTLKQCEDGAALAATQVSVLKRVVVVDYEDDHLELINPEILAGDDIQSEYEGCLSLPGYAGLVPRFNFVRLKYYDRKGRDNVIERRGMLARCFQHEIDHLDGVLFVDMMTADQLVHSKTDTTISRQSVLDITNGLIPDVLARAG